jgi:hypothetical protein
MFLIFLNELLMIMVVVIVMMLILMVVVSRLGHGTQGFLDPGQKLYNKAHPLSAHGDLL